jgi:predicted MFS family arabinose efflux permease
LTVGQLAPDAQPSRSLQLVLATACGLAVANLYYAQPVLATLAHSLSTSPARAATIVTLAQAGYALGLMFVVPLGDLFERRRLVVGVLMLSALAAAGTALAPSIGLLDLTVCILGLSSVVAQILVPLAADLSGEQVRGQVVGTVMTGLLLGILLARTVSGALAQLAGWRSVFWMTCGLMVALILLLRAVLPASRPRATVGYPRLVASVVGIFASEPELRRRAAYGAVVFGSFSVYWTVAAFKLSGPPYHYSNVVIGLFGLAGVAGAACASVAGRLADRGRSAAATGVFLAATSVAFAFLFAGGSHLWAMIVGVVVLDLGVQGTQVTNQSIIYRLRDDARSRLNTAYMVCFFVGGSVGSAVAGVAWTQAGWAGVCALGAGIGVTGLALWVWEQAGRRSAGVVAVEAAPSELHQPGGATAKGIG